MRQLDIEYLLVQWGIWVRVQAGVPRYVSPQYALMRDNVQMHGGPSPAISDDMAMVIDRHIARLYERYPECGQALWNYYRYAGMTYRQLGRLMDMHHSKVERLVSVGAGWIDGSLDQYAEAA